MELNKYEIKSLEEIEQWAKQKHDGFHKKILDLTSKPVDYLIKKIGPEKFNKIETAVENTIKTLLLTAKHTISEQDLIKRARGHGIMIDSVSELKKCNLEALDNCNSENIKFHEKAAAIQGAVLGLGGAAVAVADLTAILIQDFHMIQEIAFCYSFDSNDKIEKEIILRVIEIAIGGSEIKFRSLKEIEELKQFKNKEDGIQADKKGTSVLGARALGEYIEDLTVALLVRLIPRALPIISMVVSAHSNHEIMEHSGKTAFMIYRQRFIERKKELL
ncbi:MAG: EcsC family protein [Candidatus Omnitrophota bacterium]